MEIIFFSEGNQHTRFFDQLLTLSASKNFEITLITLDEKDNLIKNQSISNVIIPKNNVEKIKILNNLSGDYFITTTPGIGHSYFPKSKIWPKDKRPKYVYLFHSLVSPNEMYAKNSFKNFDIIFSPSEEIKKQLEYLVPKDLKIIVSGYLLFDKKSVHPIINNSQKKVLIAPTWGDSGLISDLESLKEIEEYLTNKNFEVIIRPHPMTFQNNNIMKNLNTFNLDHTHAVENFNEYEFLITDYSGIALEYYFFTKKPTLFIDSSKKIKREIQKKERSLLLIENIMRDIIGNTISLKKNKEEIKLPEIKNQQKARELINSFYNENSSLSVIEKTLFEI